MCMCGLSLAWVTSENSTSTSNADILSRSSSLDPILSPTVSGVPCWLPLSVVPRQLSTVQSQLLSSGSRHPLLSAGSRRQLSFASPSHFRIRRDFRSKNPLSGFAPKQTKESSTLAAHPHSAREEQRYPQQKGDLLYSDIGCINRVHPKLEVFNRNIGHNQPPNFLNKNKIYAKRHQRCYGYRMLTERLSHPPAPDCPQREWSESLALQ